MAVCSVRVHFFVFYYYCGQLETSFGHTELANFTHGWPDIWGQGRDDR